MTDSISLTGLRIHGFHGVFAHERSEGQDFVVDLVLSVPTSAAAASDDIEDTVDYAAVAATVAEIVAGDAVNLIETLAERIATACLQHARVQSVEVTVHKPDAPVDLPFDDIAVTIVRDRRDGRG